MHVHLTPPKTGRSLRVKELGRQSLEAKSHPVLECRPHVREEIERRGPLSSSTWSWRGSPLAWGANEACRAALEGMYFGANWSSQQSGGQETYDLAERHIPGVLLNAPEPNPTDDEYHDWHVHRRIGSVGLLANRGAEAWLGIEGTNSAKRAQSIARLLAEGKLRQVQVEGIPSPMYMRAQDESLLEVALSRDGTDAAALREAALIAPLDNLLWDRRLAS